MVTLHRLQIIYTKFAKFGNNFLFDLGIQQENRHIRQLQHENKELRAALEEHQKALELIMSKYRKQTSCLIKSTKFDETTVSNKKSAVRSSNLLTFIHDAFL